MSSVDGTFEVTGFDPVAWTPPREAGIAFGEATMGKRFSGSIEGTSVTRFIGGMTDDQRAGGYVALEWFEGVVAGRSGSCVIVHGQTLADAASTSMWLQVVPASGTGQLTGLTASGGLAVDDDGTHRIWLDLDD
jgi:hypothetical protein